MQKITAIAWKYEEEILKTSRKIINKSKKSICFLEVHEPISIKK
jgi:hypothetical protein